MFHQICTKCNYDYVFRPELFWKEKCITCYIKLKYRNERTFCRGYRTTNYTLPSSVTVCKSFSCFLIKSASKKSLFYFIGIRFTYRELGIKLVFYLWKLLIRNLAFVEDYRKSLYDVSFCTSCRS